MGVVLHPIGVKSCEPVPVADSPSQEFGTEGIGQFVRARRLAHGMTQAELGELSGAGRRFVSELERAKPTVRLDSVNRVLAVFGKTLGVVDAPRHESQDSEGEAP